MKSFAVAESSASFASAMALLLFAAGANANAIVFNNALQGGSQQDYVLGMDFDVISPVTVTQLGTFDDLGNGFASGTTIQVGIFSTTSTLLVGSSATFSSVTPGTLTGGSRFLPVVAPFVLLPGRYSIVGTGYTPGSQSGNTGLGQTTPVFDNLGGALSLVPKGGRWNEQGDDPFVLPTDNLGGYDQPDPVFLAATFAASIPDGGSASMMLGFGLLAAGFVRRLIK